MVSDKHAALEAQLSALDRDTAQRVGRLVFECSASVDLALLAVQDADRAARGHQAKWPNRRLLRMGDAAASPPCGDGQGIEPATRLSSPPRPRILMKRGTADDNRR